jgi:LytS/YehU family sensor histidine kinase
MVNIDPLTTALSIPVLCIQPLVENSIKHAFNPRSQAGILKIKTEMLHTENSLRVTVSDDGPGADLSQITDASGMGVRTIERRLQLEYGAASKFEIDTAPSAGFSVTLCIPYQ